MRRLYMRTVVAVFMMGTIVFFCGFVISAHACALVCDGERDGREKRERRSAHAVFEHAEQLSIEERLALKEELAQAVAVGNAEKVAEIIAHGVRFDFQDRMYCNYNQCWQDTLRFMGAVESKQNRVIDMLLDADQRSTYGIGIAFYAAVMFGNIEMMEALYRSGEVPDDMLLLFNNISLLMIAADSRPLSLPWLLKTGTHAFIDVQDSRKLLTALMMAVRNSSGLEVINPLLAARASVDIQNYQGNTALGLTVMGCYYEQAQERRLAIIRDLVLAGAHPLIANNKNETPWSIATADMKAVMRTALQERTLGRVVSEIVTQRGLKPYGFDCELPEGVVHLIDEFATAPLSDTDKERRVCVLEQERKRWLAEVHGDRVGFLVDENAKEQSEAYVVGMKDEFKRGMEWACVAYADSCCE